MSRNGSRLEGSTTSSVRSGQTPVRLSCSLLQWQRLQTLGRSVGSSSEKLQRYKDELESQETAHLLQAHSLKADCDNQKQLNTVHLEQLDRLKRICARKRINIAQIRENRREKDRQLGLLKKRCELIERLVVAVAERFRTKEQYLHTYTSLVRHRSRYLLAELKEIFKIELKDVGRKECPCRRLDYICSVHLPPVNALKGHHEQEFTAALGYLVQLLDCISWILDYHWRYPLVDGASTSQIIFPREDRLLALFGTRWKADRDRLDAALTLLGKNIAQLRADSGLDWPEQNCFLQSMREWLEVVVRGKGDVKFTHRPWKQIGTPALLLDDLEEKTMPGEIESNSIEPEISFKFRNGYTLSSLLTAEDAEVPDCSEDIAKSL